MENKKIGFKTVFHDLIESIGLKQGILITIKDLIIKPEKVIKYFIETRGNEKMDISKYLSPLKLFMFIFAAIAIISFVVGQDILNLDEVLYEENEKYFNYDEGLEFLADTEYYMALDDFHKNYENEQLEKIWEIYTDNQILFSLIIAFITTLFSKLFFFKRKDYNLASHFVIYIYLCSIIILVTPLINLIPDTTELGVYVWVIGYIYMSYSIIRIFKNSLIIGLIKGFFIFIIPNILFLAMFFTPFFIQSYQEDENWLHEKFVIEYPQFKDYLTCKGDCENGFGVFIYANGGIYEGNWKDGIWHGQGTYSALENEYKGDWNGTCKGDCENGFGVYIYPDEGMQGTGDGGEYVGEWKDGYWHGQGTYTWATGDKYIGEWKDDLMNGQGTYTWANGDKYIGEWKDGLRNGQGTFTWLDGEKYVGEWKDGLRNGQGTYTYADGTKESGLWENDEFLGE